MTASIIKTMASLVVYLKHIARKNDLIIIDDQRLICIQTIRSF